MVMDLRLVVLLSLCGKTFMADNDGLNSCRSPQFLEVGKKGTIQCSPMAEFFGVFWYNSRDYKTELPVLFYQESEKKGIGYEKGEFDIHPNGSLIINEVSDQHDGYFTVAYLRSREGTETQYHEIMCIVIVNPVPFYPIVKGCNHQHNCTLVVKKEGKLTCSLNGIRPIVQLVWTNVRGETLPLVSWLDSQTTVNIKDVSYDVSVTSSFKIETTLSNPVTIECRVNGTFSEVFDVATRVDLLLYFDQTTSEYTATPIEDPVPTNKLVKIVGIILPLILVSLLLGIYLFLKVYRRRRKPIVLQPDDAQEIMLKTPGTKGIEAKMRRLVEQLRESYKQMYSNVQPNPINGETIFSVEELYVEGGIEMETLSDDPIPLGSYHDMFNNKAAKPQRIVVESRPGFGKSFLTLKIAYDWCNHRSSSPLKNIEILIILQLRKMEGIASVHQGILQTILPQSTSLSKADIKNILSRSNGTSVLIVLDGYDEYENKYDGKKFDINNIISGRMLKKVNVILTTRTAHFPKKVADETKTMRLTGFSDKTRQLYVEKFLGSSSVEKFDYFRMVLGEYEEVRELCSTPMFWVMFVHMYQEEKEEVLSITRILRCITACLQHQMYLKFGEEWPTKLSVFETGHHSLNELAYKSITSVDKQIMFEKSFIKQFGENTYKQFICSGILVEETDKDSFLDSTEDQSSETRVKFQWPIFAYWYAANFLVKVIGHDTSGGVDTPLLTEDKLCTFAIVYRFACGIEGSSASAVFEHTKSMTSSEQFLTLCFLEKCKCLSKVMQTIDSVCKKGLIISGHDSLLEQKSSLQLIKLASTYKITIAKLVLHDCIKEITKDTHEIITESRLKVSNKLPLLSLVVFSRNRDLTDEEIKKVLQFSGKCSTLAILEFTTGVPPMKFEDRFLQSVSMSKTLKVRWRARSSSSPYILNMKSGKWENEINKTELTEDDTGKALLQSKQDREKFTKEDYKKELQLYRETLRKLAAV